MKKLLIFLFLALCSFTNAGTRVQSKANSAGSAQTNQTVTLDSNTTAHNLLLVSVRLSATGRTYQVCSGSTDCSSSTDTFTQIQDSDNWRTWYAKNIAGGVNTVTVHISAGGTATMYVSAMEVSGSDQTSPFDQTATGSGSSTNVSTGATSATTQANEFIWAAMRCTATQTSITNANDTSYTIDTNGTYPGGASVVSMAYKNVTSTGAQTGQFKLATSTGWATTVATFKDFVPLGPIFLFEESRKDDTKLSLFDLIPPFLRKLVRS